MPMYDPLMQGINDDQMSYEMSQEFSFSKALLWDPDSFYDSNLNHFGQHDNEFNYCHNAPKSMKIELTTAELLAADVHNYNDSAYNSKFIEHWTTQDCLFWMSHELHKLGLTLPDVQMETLASIDGNTLKNMTAENFENLVPKYGLILFNRLDRFKAASIYNSICTVDQGNNVLLRVDDSFSHVPTTLQDSHTLTDLDTKAGLSHFASYGLSYCPTSDDSGYKSDSSSGTTLTEQPPQVPEKRRPGRPRGTKKKKKPEKLGRLWEFIRDLLLNEKYNPSLICWENYDEGTFRFVHSDRVAKLWGSKKDNVDMNYEKLSRAMRYYYKSKVLQPVYGKRLVYKFGPTATGWRSEKPIFRQS